MARQSLASQVSQLLERCSRLETENAQLRHSLMKPTTSPVVVARKATIASLGAKAAAYCKAHGLKSCSIEQVLNWK